MPGGWCRRDPQCRRLQSIQERWLPPDYVPRTHLADIYGSDPVHNSSGRWSSLLEKVAAEIREFWCGRHVGVTDSPADKMQLTEMANHGLWASHPEAKAPEIESVVTIANEPDSILLPAVPRADQPEPEPQP